MRRDDQYLLYGAIEAYWRDAMREYVASLFPPPPRLFGYVVGYQAGSLRSMHSMPGAELILRNAEIRRDGVLILDAA